MPERHVLGTRVAGSEELGVGAEEPLAEGLKEPVVRCAGGQRARVGDAEPPEGSDRVMADLAPQGIGLGRRGLRNAPAAGSRVDQERPQRSLSAAYPIQTRGLRGCQRLRLDPGAVSAPDEGLPQAEFAGRLQLAGWDISRETLAKVESQARCATDRELVRFAEALEVEPTELLRPAKF